MSSPQYRYFLEVRGHRGGYRIGDSIMLGNHPYVINSMNAHAAHLINVTTKSSRTLIVGQYAYIRITEALVLTPNMSIEEVEIDKSLTGPQIDQNLKEEAWT